MIKKLSHSDFITQMDRVIEQFGIKAFSQERSRLIFREVQDITVFQFRKICDDFLMGSKWAPLPKDFREAATIPKRTNQEIEKNENREASASMYTSDELAIISKAMQQGIDGNTEVMNKILRGLKPSRVECNHCADSGLVFAITIGKPWYADTVFNCFCKKSQNNKNYGVWGQRFMGELKNKNMRTIEDLT